MQLNWERVVFSDGQYRHSVGCLWPSALGVWRLFENLEVGSGTDLGWVWEEGGKGPRRLCVRTVGQPRPWGWCAGAVGVHWSWVVRPSLWALAAIWASVADCHPVDSPNCCLWMLGYLEFEKGHEWVLLAMKVLSVNRGFMEHKSHLWWWRGPSNWAYCPSWGCARLQSSLPAPRCGSHWKWRKRRRTR